MPSESFPAENVDDDDGDDLGVLSIEGLRLINMNLFVQKRCSLAEMPRCH